MNSIIKELSAITTIPINSLQKLKEKEVYLICNAVEEATLQGEALTEVNIGIGNLIILIENGFITYKFAPSSKLEKNLVSTIMNKKNPLTNLFEETLANKVVKTYKDML
jgi:hypothetical protein